MERSDSHEVVVRYDEKERVSIHETKEKPEEEIVTYHFARPGILYVKRGDTVTFRTENTRGHFWFPYADELFEGAEHHLMFELDEGGSETFTISENAGIESVHQYAVFCDNGRGFAEAASSPRIIVEEEPR